MSKVSLMTLSLLVSVTAVMAESFSTVEYVKVHRSTPIYSMIQENVPSEECYDVREEARSGGGGSNIVGALAGGALGGVLGHQIGGGSGKTVATVGGAVLGTLAGQKVASSYGAEDTHGYRTVRKCDTRYILQTREVLSGYTNVAKFKGKKIHVESDYPLKEIPVTVTYSF